MLIDGSLPSDKSELQRETDFKAVLSIYQKSTIIFSHFKDANGRVYILREVIPMSGKGNSPEKEIRKELLKNFKILREVFILDTEDNKYYYFSRDKTDNEKFEEVAGDLF